MGTTAKIDTSTLATLANQNSQGAGPLATQASVNAIPTTNFPENVSYPTNTNRYTDTTTVSTTSTGPVTMYAVVVPYAGRVRVVVDYNTSSGSYAGNLKILVDGVVVGGPYTTTTFAPSVATVTLDVKVQKGSEIEFQLYSNGGGINANAQNFRINYDLTINVVRSI